MYVNLHKILPSRRLPFLAGGITGQRTLQAPQRMQWAVRARTSDVMGSSASRTTGATAVTVTGGSGIYIESGVRSSARCTLPSMPTNQVRAESQEFLLYFNTPWSPVYHGSVFVGQERQHGDNCEPTCSLLCDSRASDLRPSRHVARLHTQRTCARPPTHDLSPASLRTPQLRRLRAQSRATSSFSTLISFLATSRDCVVLCFRPHGIGCVRCSTRPRRNYVSVRLSRKRPTVVTHHIRSTQTSDELTVRRDRHVTSSRKPPCLSTVDAGDVCQPVRKCISP